MTAEHVVGGGEVGDLLARCRDGDRDAWNQLVVRFESLVYAIPVHSGLSDEDAADVVQNTFQILYEGIESVREPERLGLWLMTVARRQVTRVRRQQSAESSVDIAYLGGHEPATGDGVELFARAAALHAAVRRMHEPCRSLIMALFFDASEPTYDEIAMRLGRPVGSIGPLRGRCLERLREVLSTGGFGNG